MFPSVEGGGGGDEEILKRKTNKQKQKKKNKKKQTTTVGRVIPLECTCAVYNQLFILYVSFMLGWPLKINILLL